MEFPMEIVGEEDTKGRAENYGGNGRLPTSGFSHSISSGAQATQAPEERVPGSTENPHLEFHDGIKAEY